MFSEVNFNNDILLERDNLVSSLKVTSLTN